MKIHVIECLVGCALVLAAGAVRGEDWNRIYLGDDPAVTRDGKSFYFTWNDHIWFASTEGGTARLVSPSTAREAAPVLSPDGTRLAYLSDCDGAMRVYECPTDLARPAGGNAVRQLSGHSESTRPWCYTPNGKSLICTVFRDHAGPKDALRIVRLPTAAQGPETLVFDLLATSPSLSPDGKSLLFVKGTGSRAPFRKRRHSTTSQKGSIWRYDLAGKTFTCMVE